jgi:hypothetical protein
MNCHMRGPKKTVCVGYVAIYNLRDASSVSITGSSKYSETKDEYAPVTIMDGPRANTAETTIGTHVEKNIMAAAMVSMTLTPKDVATNTAVGEAMTEELEAPEITLLALATSTAGGPKITGETKGAWIAGGMAAVAIGAVAGL